MRVGVKVGVRERGERFLRLRGERRRREMNRRKDGGGRKGRKTGKERGEIKVFFVFL